MRALALALVVGLALGCAQSAEEPPTAPESPVPAPPDEAAEGLPEAAEPPPAAEPEAGDPLRICSFNIQFLGSFKKRDDQALADLVKDYDVVVVQELVSPFVEVSFADGTSMTADPEAREFLDAMTGHGFEFWLSDEDTGSGDTIHTNGTGTEWWVTFFKPDRVSRADDLPHGFLADDRSNHPDYERVPYAFSFRTSNGAADFVLISVHLKPNGDAASRARRKHELASIAAWVDQHDDQEKDFIILGDMNIENAAELADATPAGFLSLNDECRPTNTNLNVPKPYDHVMYRPEFTAREIDEDFDLQVVDLIEAVRDSWTGPASYPGDPYDHNAFRQFFSDHHPVACRLSIEGPDDD